MALSAAVIQALRPIALAGKLPRQITIIILAQKGTTEAQGDNAGSG